MIVTRAMVEKERPAYKFTPENGYARLGRLPLPALPVYSAIVCEPDGNAKDGTRHIIKPPNDGATGVVAIWHKAEKEWEPVGVNGRRVAFESRYLAAHGWVYGGPHNG